MTIGGSKRQDQTKVVEDGASGKHAQFDGDDRETQLRRGSVFATVTIVEGPGTGNSFQVYRGDNAIGRGPQNRIELDFGDESIHREPHAWIRAEEGSFIVEHGGKANPVHVNGDRIDGFRKIAAGDRIKIGSTTLRFDPK
jgi:Inner membrane component of T3SS, cytoplasmic domain